MPEETSPGVGAAEEAHHRFLQFLRGLSELDDALGPWRPDYGGMPARAAPEADAGADLAAAHQRYATALSYFADHPDATWSLGEPARDDVSAAIADSRMRFGSPVVPLEALTGSAPFGTEEPGAAGEVGGETPPDTPGAEGAPMELLPVGAPLGEAEPEGRPPRNPLALLIGVASLLVTALIVAAIVVAAKVFLGPGPTAQPATTVTPPLSASTPTPGPLPDVLAPARACPALPSGRLAAGLAPTAASSGIAIDPHTGYSTPEISVTLAQPVQTGTPSLSVVIPVLQFGAAPPSSGGPLDRAGTVQLIAYWSRGTWYAAIRDWSGSSWSAPSDGANPGVDVSQRGRTVTLSWMGLTPGDRYGAVVAAGGACAVLDLDSGLSPTQAYGS